MPGFAAWSPTRRRAAAWALACTLAVAALGGWATDIGPWYLALRQPPWKPPDLWFGPIWTTIYALTATAAVRVWERLPSLRERRAWLAMLALNAALHIGWSVLFFTCRRPDWALPEAVLLWLSVALLMAAAVRRCGWSALMLLPYLAWVGLATVLNAAVVRLN